MEGENKERKMGRQGRGTHGGVVAVLGKSNYLPQLCRVEWAFPTGIVESRT